MAVHVTRCPHCQTSFRVRDEHLGAAKGMVRCGSCLQVFKAAEHFIDEPTAEETPAPQAEKTVTKPEAPATAATSAAEDDDDIGLIHDDMDDDPIPEQLADDPFTDLGLRTPEKQSRPKPRETIELDESIFSLKNVSSDTLDFISDDDEDSGKARDDDESWANALLEDDEPISSDSVKLDSDDEFNFDLPPPEHDDFQGFADEDDPDLSSDSYALNGESDLETETLEITVPAAGVDGLQEEPLEFQGKSRKTAQFPWGWFSASALMLVIAAAQAMYFQFDELARTPQWRPWYAKICEVAGCTLPKVQNIREMTTQHLVVRPHPDLQRALVVDTLLVNKAEYEQPFPDLTLVFKDLNDNIVASRRFAPDQYLSGELAGQSDMPVHTPIHIALEVVDPGPEAVSYAIALEGNQ